MGEVLINCPFCDIEMRNSIYKAHICLGDKMEDFEQLRDFLLDFEYEEELDS